MTMLHSHAPAPMGAMNPVHALQDALGSAFARQNSEPAAEATPSVADCLKPLLDALGWTGDARHLHEALPHFDAIDTLDGLRAVLARLGYQSERRRLSLRDVTDQALPALIDMGDRVVVVVARASDHELAVYDPGAGGPMIWPADDQKHVLYHVFAIDQRAATREFRRLGWTRSVITKFQWPLLVILGLTLVINLVSLLTPVATMNIYDKALAARSPMTLLYLVAAIGIVLLAEVVLRTVRGRALAYLGTRIENLVTLSSFQHLLHMPVAMTDSAPVGSQITRLKQFEGVRDLFNGPLMAALMDVPFLVIFVAAIFAISGPLGWIPVALLVVYCLIAAIAVPVNRYHMAKAGDGRAETRNAVVEMTQANRAIRRANAVEPWCERYAEASAKAHYAQYRAQQFAILMQTIAQSLMTVAGVATIGLGAVMVMAGTLSIGGLIAVMALVWRVLAPVQAIFLSFTRIGQALDSLKQIDSLLRLDLERQPGALPGFYRDFDGAISVQSVSMRYTGRGEPALRGASLEIAAKECVAITGSSGSGKSSLLRAIARLYVPQSGLVRMDGLDIRQIDAGELRTSLGFVPQKPQVFYGTIAQNISLARPTADRAEIEAVVERLGMAEEIARLPEGLDTRLTHANAHLISDGLAQQIALARAFIREAAVYLLDEPGSALDFAADQAFMTEIKKRKGQATILLVTHRPSHMMIADRVVVMAQGAVLTEGKPEEIVPKLLKAA